MRKVLAFSPSVTMLAGLTLTIGVVLAITVGPLVFPHTATSMDFSNLLTPPSWSHPFGTDALGRDVLARVFEGARLSLTASAFGVAGAAIIGTLTGMAAGYRGGILDISVMRLADLIFAFPSFVLALFMMSVLGFGFINIAAAIALTYLPNFARLARNLTLMVRDEPYVLAARLSGRSQLSILTGEILPNIVAPLVVQATVAVAFGVVIEAGLSFLGLGVQPPQASLGTIMADGRGYFERGPWVLTLTGLSIATALLGLNLLGDGLRDLSDPRLRRRAGLDLGS